jgi:hypothetical protein
MLNWKKTYGNHARSREYGMFLQLRRRKRWLYEDAEVWRTVEWLRRTYGAEYTREPVPTAGAVAFHRQIPNEQWTIDHARRRIYLKESKLLTFMYLTQQ